jgi:hypothetical protein
MLHYTKNELDTFYICLLSSTEYHYAAASIFQRHGFCTIRNVGFRTRDWWDVHSATSESGITSKEGQWSQRTKWGEQIPLRTLARAKYEKNNANEGNIFVIAGITTQSALAAWVNQTFFMLSSTEQSTLLNYYSFIASPQEAAYVSYIDWLMIDYKLIL